MHLNLARFGEKFRCAYILVALMVSAISPLSAEVEATSIDTLSPPTFGMSTPPLWACDLFRAAFLDKTAVEKSFQRKRIYITHRSSVHRSPQTAIENADEFAAYLEKNGFETVDLNNLSIKEQARIFNNAEIIIAAHGTPLTNLIFCDTESPITLIELYPHNTVSTYESTLTQELNSEIDPQESDYEQAHSLAQQLNHERGFHLDYFCLTTDAARLSSHDRSSQHIVVDCDQLDRSISNAYRSSYSKKITTQELSQTSYYKKVRDAYAAPFVPNPVLQSGLRVKDASDQKTILFPEQFVITLPQAALRGYEGLIITEGKRPFLDYVHQVGRTCDWKVITLQGDLEEKSVNNPELFHGTLAIIASPGAHSYYHWMLDILPRLKTLQMGGAQYDKLFVGSKHQKYKQETLKLCSLPDNSILYGDKTTHIKADTLVVPSMPNLFGLKRPTWACDFVRSLFLDSSITEKKLPRKKLFITRKNVSLANSQRMIINEQEISSFLKQNGFECTVLEDLSIKRQVELFYSAEVIIAAHGASLTNVIFCNPQHPITIIELYHPEHINECYTSLTQQLNNDRGFKFNHLCHITSTDKLSAYDKQVKNMYVSRDQMKELLKKIVPSKGIQ